MHYWCQQSDKYILWLSHDNGIRGRSTAKHLVFTKVTQIISVNTLGLGTTELRLELKTILDHFYLLSNLIGKSTL